LTIDQISPNPKVRPALSHICPQKIIMDDIEFFLKIQLGRVVEDFKLNLLVLKKMGFDFKNRELSSLTI
jgi:hypothetical protein